MTERLLEFRQRYFPARLELTLLLLLIFAVGISGFYALLSRQWQLLVPLTGVLIAPLIVWIGGTRLCFILYYITNLGMVLRVPGIPVSGNQIAAALLFASIALDVYRYRTRFKWSTSLVLFLLFNVYFLTVTVLTAKPEWGYPINVLFYLIPISSIIALYWREKWLMTMLNGFILVTFLFVVLPGLFESATGLNITPFGISGTTTRPNGLAMDAIFYAYTATWMIPVAAVFFIESRDPLAKLYYLAMMLCFIAATFLSGNRQNPIITSIMLLVLLALVRYRHRLLLVGIFVALGLLITPFVYTKLEARFSKTQNWMTDHSLLYRHDKILIAQEVWKEHFWFGLGLDHFHIVWRDYIPSRKLVNLDKTDPKDMYMDSGYIQLMTEFGIVGFVLFWIMMLTVLAHLAHLYRLSRKLEDTWYTNMIAAIAAMLTQMLVAMLISDCFIRLQTYYTLAILFTMNIILHLRLQAEQVPAPTAEREA